MKKYQVFKVLLVPSVVLFLLTISIYCSAAKKNQADVLTLDQAIQEAITNNSLIKEAIEKERAAIEGEKSATADLLPKLSATYSYTRLKHSPYAIFHYSSIAGFPSRGSISPKVEIGDKDNFAWNVGFSQPLFTGFALITKRKMAKIGIDIQKVIKDQAVLDIAKQVKLAYFSILLAKRYAEVATEEVNQLRAHVRDAKQFYNQGLIPFNDVLKSKVALAQSRQNLIHAKSNLAVAIANLNILLEREITATTRVRDIPSFQPATYNLENLFERALKNRPEMKHLRLALHRASLATALARSNYYPRIYLNGKYEQAGDNIQATNNEFTNSHNASIGFNAEWTFFEWGKTKAEVEKSVHERQALESKVKRVADSIKLEVEDAYQETKVAEQNITTAKEALTQAKENFRITNLQYQQQVTTSTEVLDARTFLTQAEVNYFGALYGYMTAKAELDRAIGEK